MDTSQPRRWRLAGVVLFIVVTTGALTLGGGGGRKARPEEKLRGRENVPGAQILLDPKDTIVLLLDHQTGLFQTVKDVPVRDLRANAVVLAKVAELAKAPI